MQGGIYRGMPARISQPGASIPMGQGGHVPPIFMKGGHPW